MPLSLATRASAVVLACVTAIAFAPPVFAEPMDPIPGNGVFVVGPDIAPGLYRTAGSASTFGRLDKQCADPGLDVRVVHLQHTRCEP